LNEAVELEVVYSRALTNSTPAHAIVARVNLLFLGGSLSVVDQLRTLEAQLQLSQKLTFVRIFLKLA
jgi:hypothetical protein